MSQQLTSIKTRIKSVSGALKVTSAMKLVSTVKLKKWKNKMLNNRLYAEQIADLTKRIVSYAENSESPFLKTNERVTKKLYIIVSSSLGLCGSYNANIFKEADAKITKDDAAIILGNKGLVHYQNEQFTKIEGFEKYASINDEGLIRQLTNYVINEYLKGAYQSIHIIYSEYKNSLVFLAKDFQILPLNVKEESNAYPPILEPNENDLLDSLTRLYFETIMYAKLLESEVCEQASRSNAMENATDNANELLANLQIEFNKARQAAITQEIVEIVGAAESL